MLTYDQWSKNTDTKKTKETRIVALFVSKVTKLMIIRLFLNEKKVTIDFPSANELMNQSTDSVDKIWEKAAENALFEFVT